MCYIILECASREVQKHEKVGNKSNCNRIWDICFLNGDSRLQWRNSAEYIKTVVKETILFVIR